MSGNPKECRRNALSCMQLAQTAPSPEAREHFADLARTWLRLAGDIESGQALVDLLDDLEPEPERRAG
jgi:ubiquinone biosynthesis protein UbiJ